MSLTPRLSIVLIPCLSALLAAVAAPPRASASILFEVAGPPYTSSGIGVGNGQQAGAVGFSTAHRLENVTFTVPLSFTTTGQPPHTVNAYLTNSIGPGTTAANLLAQNSIVINSGQSGEFQVTSFPALDPGTYYLMLIDFGFNFVGWESRSLNNHTITAAPGVQLVASLAYAQESGAFPPAYQPNGDTRDASLFASVRAIRIEGDFIPEPASFALGIGGLGTCAAYGRASRKRSSR